MRRRRWRTAAFIAGLALWVTAPLVAVGWVLATSTNQSAVAPDKELWVAAIASTDSVSRDAAVQLLWEPSAVVRAPAWSGLILRVFVEPGASLSSGTPVVEVDGIDRRAYATDGAFFRSLQVDDEGPDVLALNSLLAPYGAPAGSDLFEWSSVRALRLFAAEIGVPDASRVTVFDPTWVIHIPVSDPVQIGSVSLVAGESAPTLGTQIISGTTSLTGARLVAVATEPPDGLLTRSEFIDATTPLALAPDTAETVRYRELSLKVGDGGWLVPEDLDALTDVVIGRPPSLPVVVARSATVGDVSLPAAAVSAGRLSQVCISLSGRNKLIDIEVVNGTAGKVVVRATGLVAGVKVRIPNPSVTPCE